MTTNPTILTKKASRNTKCGYDILSVTKILYLSNSNTACMHVEQTGAKNPKAAQALS